MKARLFALSSALILSTLTAAGCTATPEAYHKAYTRVSCRAIKKCEEDVWKEAGYDNVGDCVDKSLKEFSEDDFADLCEDYDKAEARKCLRSGRKYKRSCDDGDIDDDACSKVCGNLATGELTPEDRGRAAAEAKFAAGELDEDELDELEEQEADEEALLQAEIDAVYDEED